MAERPLYVVTHWDAYFETHESKRLVKACAWVPIPNKHDGKSYRRLTAEKDAVAIYGAWMAIVQVASKCPLRGVLADLDGPLDSLDLQDKTGFPERAFTRALDFTSSERIGWVRQVTDQGEIETLLRLISAAKCVGSRRRPQPPADSAESPQIAADSAESPQIAADSAESPQVAQIPADVRRFPQMCAPRGRAQADRTGPDRTGPDTLTPAGESEPGSLDALADTEAFLIGLFSRGTGKKRTRLSYEGTTALSRWNGGGSLPLGAGQKAILTWFYGLPAGDPPIFELKIRKTTAEKLAADLFGEIERAEAYSDTTPGAGARTSEHLPAIEPAGWREWLADNYPDNPPPETYWLLPASIRSEIELKGEAA